MFWYEIVFDFVVIDYILDLDIGDVVFDNGGLM